MPLPFVDGEFSETREPIRAARMELRRAAYAHEVLIMRTNSEYSGAYPTGAPVRVSWGSFPSSTDTFFGYVHHDEPVADEHERASRPLTDIVCVGATGGSLGDHGARTWLNTRADFLVEDVAREAGLIPATHPGRSVLSDVSQAAESSWKFLSRIAREDGKVLFGRGLTVALLDRAVAVSELGDLAPVIKRGEALRVRGRVGDLDVDSRESVVRDAFSLGEAGLVAATDRGRAQRSHVVLPPPRERRIIAGSSKSAGGLVRAIEADHRHEDFLYTLTVELRGTRAGLVPTSVVQLRDFGRRYDGYWSVNEVTYRLTPSERATTEVVLRRAPVPARNSSSRRGEVRANGTRRRARLVAGRWVAA